MAVCGDVVSEVMSSERAPKKNVNARVGRR